MKPFHLWTKSDIRQGIEARAKLFAFRKHRREHPGLEEREAHKYAELHWEQFRGTAADLLAVQLVDAEQQSAPMN